MPFIHFYGNTRLVDYRSSTKQEKGTVTIVLATDTARDLAFVLADLADLKKEQALPKPKAAKKPLLAIEDMTTRRLTHRRDEEFDL